MEISKRLQTIADLVQYDSMADIGTDHGYIPIWLYTKKRITKAIACDINKGPLKRASQNISNVGAEYVIQTRLGDGLQPLLPNEVESVVIAGMGGMLIINILEARRTVVDEVKELILSPQLDVPNVRRYLHSIGFLIENECMIVEDGKYYNIMRAVPGNESYADIEYTYGKILLANKNKVLLEYINTEKNRLLKLYKKLENEKSDQAVARFLDIQNQLTEIREAEKWL